MTCRLTVLVIVTAFAVACSSADSPDNGKSSASRSVSANAPNIALSSNAAANANVPPVPDVNSNSSGRLGRVNRPIVEHSGPEMPLQFRPAAENSQLATQMNDQGQPVEIRVFKDHPQLARVEATWLSPQEKIIKITLKNGSTTEVRTDKVGALGSAPAALLVQLAAGAK